MTPEISTMGPAQVARRLNEARHAPNLTSDRIPVVDGLRGLALLLVLLFHIQLFALKLGPGLWERTYSLIAGLGWAGVDLFFVLSGFLITRILISSQASTSYYRTFYARRTLRIFPLYYASLGLYFVVVPAFLRYSHHDQAATDLIMPSSQVFAWTYTLNWRMLAAPHAVPEFIQHFWTLAIEEQFYLVWPLVVRHCINRGLNIVCAAMILGSLLLRIVFTYLHLPGATLVTFCRLDALGIGASLAYYLYRTEKWYIAKKVAPIATGISIAGLCMIVLITGQSSSGSALMSTVGISLCGILSGGILIMALESNPRGLVPRLAGFSGLRFLGIYSYCLYICHQPLIIAASRGLGINSDTIAILVRSNILAVTIVDCIDIVVPTVIALLSWHLFEKHFLKLKNQLVFS